MKKMMRIAMLSAALAFAVTNAAGAKDLLAILPFTGGEGEDGETMAELFSFEKELTAAFTPVPRTSINIAIQNEQRFQMGSGMTDPDTIAALGKQLGAQYVVAGSITRLGTQKLLIIAIIKIDELRQVAGDIRTYGAISEIRGKLPSMAKNIVEASRKDASKLPRLAVPPVRLAGGADTRDADTRDADTLAQILAVHLIGSGKYAVYPRTKSLEQVQAEYGNQFGGDVADEYLPTVGMGNNPRLVLSVTARKLDRDTMFNAAVINLETGIQEAGESVDYRSLEDGVRVMEELALKLSGQEEKAAQIKAAAEAEVRAKAEAKAVAEARAKAEAEARVKAEAEARVKAEAEARAKAAAEAKAKAQAESDAKLAADAKAGRLAVRDLSAFAQAITAINNDKAGGSYTITLNTGFTSAPVTFTGNVVKTITLKGDGAMRTITNSGGGDLFTVPKDVTLTLDNGVTLDGNNKEAYLVSISGGTFIMKTGSMVRGAKKNGVYVGFNSTFTMQGGTITGNSASNGGGVFVENGTFTMQGGEVSKNTATDGGGGVYVGFNSTFTMQGGTISDNSADRDGGGVKVLFGTSFTMQGGEISKNTAADGGGVNVNNGGAFTMEGGTISGNSASSSGGGGVVVIAGTFTMRGGTISRNTAKYGGGGVFVVYDGTFMMEGGTISGNSAGIVGGGVFVWENGAFIKRGRSTIDAANSALVGKAAYVLYGDNVSTTQRNSAAGPNVDMDSGKSGSAGGWE
jgi:TolB-like protein